MLSQFLLIILFVTTKSVLSLDADESAAGEWKLHFIFNVSILIITDWNTLKKFGTQFKIENSCALALTDFLTNIYLNLM